MVHDLILCSISQDCIPLLGFEARFSFELILCNQLLVSKVIYICIVTSLDLQDKKLVFFREPQTFLIYWGKNIRLKASYKWFLKCGALLYCTGLFYT